MFHVNILLMCKTFNIKSEGFPSTHLFLCSIFFVNNFGVASVLILSYLTCLFWWASLKAVVLMDWTHHNHDQTHQHHSHCFDQHRHQKLTRYWLGGKVGALSHWGRSDFCGCGNNFISYYLRFSQFLESNQAKLRMIILGQFKTRPRSNSATITKPQKCQS